MKGILGRKLGMTQVFTTDGELVPVTVVEATPNIVLQKKTIEKDGYVAVQLGFEDIKEFRATKPAIGHAKKANTGPKRFAREIAGEEMANLEVGAEVKVDLFSAGDIVDVSGVSKGKGFMGAVYRNNQHLGPASHGSGHHRGVGSLATVGRNNGYINKGRAMAGHEGALNTTVQNLEVIKVDVDGNYLLIKGNVPGPRKGLVVVKTTVKSVKSVPAKELVDFNKKEEEPIVDEVVEIVDVVEPIVEEAVVEAVETPVVEEVVTEEPVVVEETAVEEPVVAEEVKEEE